VTNLACVALPVKVEVGVIGYDRLRHGQMSVGRELQLAGRVWGAGREVMGRRVPAAECLV